MIESTELLTLLWISSAAIQHMKSPEVDRNHRVAYFYCSNKYPSKNHDIFSSFVSQLAWSKEGLLVANSVKSMYERRRRRDRPDGRGKPSLSECVDLIIELADMWSRVTFIIDALDECYDAWETLDDLRRIHTESKADIKILLSSRMVAIKVQDELPNCRKILVDRNKNKRDLIRYIKREILNAGLSGGSHPRVGDIVFAMLLGRSQGM